MLRMKTAWLTGVLLLVLQMMPAQAAGDFSRGLFWQVKSAGGQVSWLAGSIHVGNAQVESRIVLAEKLLQRAQRLVLELDSQEMHKAAQLMQRSQEAPFSAGMAPEMAVRTRSALLARGMAAEQIDHTPSWLAILILASPPKAEPGMDARLLRAATSARKPVAGLESAREQLDIFRGMPADVQSAILSMLVSQPDQLNSGWARLYQLYASENLEGLVDVEFETTVPETLSVAQQAAVLDRLVNQRNLRMAERMETYLKQGRALIAIGALHLPGVLRELEAMGYTVTRMEL